MNAKVIKSEPPESTELMAASIVKISAAMGKLLTEPGGLTTEAIVLLLHDYTKVGKPDIRAVLKALPQLRGYYCRKS
jgi:hypothetical protein